MSYTLIRVFIAALFLALWQSPTSAQNKTLRILVGFPPGQATDLVARILAEQLQPILDQPVIVENKPGQGGSVVLAQLARAEPDGSQMVLGALAAYVANPRIYSAVNYDTLTDFAPVAQVAELPLVLVVNPKVQAKSLGELVALAKSEPGKFTHSSSGVGTLSHLGMEHLKRSAGIDILHVAYRGSAPAVNDLIGGRIDVMMDTMAVTMPQVEAGNARLLAVCTSTRVPDLPNVPTIAELGYPGFHASAWLGTVFPKGTPQPIVSKISDAILKIVAQEDVKKRMLAIGAIPRPKNAQDFASFLRSEWDSWGRIIAASGLKRE
jgi:tripartite-type tricarboxylate transporter receptor subunit TctC